MSKDQLPGRGVIDLTGPRVEPFFLCDFCEVRMLPYPKLRIENPYAGDGFICPKCGIIIDSSYNKLRNDQTIEPIISSAATQAKPITFLQEEKGLRKRVDEYDIDEWHDKWLEAQGFKIIDKKIEVNRD